MTNSVIHKGGYACGEIRYKAKGEPQATAVCNFRYCQLRFGSVFWNASIF